MSKLFIAIALILLLNCQQATGPNSAWPVIYKVTGTVKTVSIVYQTNDPAPDSVIASIPWQFTFMGIENNFVFLQAATQDSGLLKCEIIRNKVPFAAHDTTGKTVSVTVSGKLTD